MRALGPHGHRMVFCEEVLEINEVGSLLRMERGRNGLLNPADGDDRRGWRRRSNTPSAGARRAPVHEMACENAGNHSKTSGWLTSSVFDGLEVNDILLTG